MEWLEGAGAAGRECQPEMAQEFLKAVQEDVI